MSEFERLRFRIDAYRPETMPMGRLAAYLAQLALLLGEEAQVHLIEIEEGSTVPVLLVEREAAPKVRRRATQARTGEGPSEARRAYDALNTLLAEDDARGALEDAGGAEIIPFPGGREQGEDVLASVFERGSLDGQLIRLDGRGDEWIPLSVRAPDGEVISRVRTRKALAKAMAPRLFENLRLNGHGRWERNREAQWTLRLFVVESFEGLDQTSLPDAVAALRAVKADWPEDAIDGILADRAEPEAQG